jgi:hypothetical protein
MTLVSGPATATKRHVAAWPRQSVECDRNRLCPTEQEGRTCYEEKGWNDDRSERIEVLQWVEGDPTRSEGGIVA